ncbi:alpha/beta hydrolase family protein [Mycobacterium sp. MMS18-G62]
METVEYAPGRLVDVFGSPGQPTALLWHGAQTDARAAMRPLAERLAGHGIGVVLPDWNSHADDGGRDDLLRSARFASDRAEESGDLVVVGWSLGGVAAAGLTFQARRLNVRVAQTVCLAGAFMARDPVSGEVLPTELPADRSPFSLLHGTGDDVVPIEASRVFAATLQRNHWPVELVELATDHGAIAGAVYDPAADRYSAADDAATLAVAAEVAERVAAAF